MKTRKLLIAAFLLSSATASLAQTKAVRFGIHAGGTFSNMKFKAEGLTISPNSIFGVQAGFITDIPINKHFSFQPGLNFVQKGTKINDGWLSGSEPSITIRLNYIEMPMNFLYNSKGKNGNFFVGAGPNLSYAISGKTTEETDGEKLKEKVDIGDKEFEDDIRGLDFGINAIAGYEFKKGLFVAANYNFGIRNLTPGGDKDNISRANYAGVRIGYFFNRK